LFPLVFVFGICAVERSENASREVALPVVYALEDGRVVLVLGCASKSRPLGFAPGMVSRVVVRVDVEATNARDGGTILAGGNGKGPR
jgi:hypothetical protein